VSTPCIHLSLHLSIHYYNTDQFESTLSHRQLEITWQELTSALTNVVVRFVPWTRKRGTTLNRRLAAPANSSSSGPSERDRRTLGGSAHHSDRDPILIPRSPRRGVIPPRNGRGLAVLPVPPCVMVDLFPAVDLQTTVLIHTPNRTPLLPKATSSPHYRKWALTIARMEKRQRLFPPATLSEVRLCPRRRTYFENVPTTKGG
jgi:hypothetical protein